MLDSLQIKSSLFAPSQSTSAAAAASSALLDHSNTYQDFVQAYSGPERASTSFGVPTALQPAVAAASSICAGSCSLDALRGVGCSKREAEVIWDLLTAWRLLHLGCDPSFGCYHLPLQRYTGQPALMLKLQACRQEKQLAKFLVRLVHGFRKKAQGKGRAAVPLSQPQHQSIPDSAAAKAAPQRPMVEQGVQLMNQLLKLMAMAQNATWTCRPTCAGTSCLVSSAMETPTSQSLSGSAQQLLQGHNICSRVHPMELQVVYPPMPYPLHASSHAAFMAHPGALHLNPDLAVQQRQQQQPWGGETPFSMPMAVLTSLPPSHVANHGDVGLELGAAESVVHGVPRVSSRQALPREPPGT